MPTSVAIAFAVGMTLLTKVMIVNADIPLEKKMKMNNLFRKTIFAGAIILGFIIF